MRKITSILSMFLLIAGWNTASAQFAFKKFASFGDDITDVSQLVNGGYYVLQNFEGNKCIKIKTDGSMVLGFDDKITDDDASDGLAVFKLHIDKSGSTPLYSFESARTGYYIPTIKYDHHKDGGVVVSTTEGKFELRTEATVNSYTNVKEEPKAGYFTIKNSTDNYYLDVFSSKNLLTGWEGNGDRAWFKIRKANLNEDASALQVFYKVETKKGEELVSTAYGIATTGDAYNSYTEPANKSYYLTTLEEPENKVITEGNMTLVYKYSGTAPFEVGQWYSLKIANGNRVLRADAENTSLFVNTNSGSDLTTIANTYPNFLNALWRIEESGFGVKIYNKGIGKYLKTNKSGTDKSKRVSFDNTGTVFYVKKNGNGLAFYTGSGYGYLNACCNDASNTPNACLGVWDNSGSPTDPGSRLLLEFSENELLEYGKTAFAATGNVSYTNYNALKKGGNYSKYKSSVDAATTLNGLFNVTDNVNLVGAYPEADAYYLIRNVNGGELGCANYENGGVTVDPENDRFKYLSTSHMTCNTEGQNASNQTLKRVKGKSDLLPLLWKFVKVEGQDGQYYLQNANMNACVNFNVVPTAANEAAQKTAFTFEATYTAYNNSAFHATNDGVSMFLMKTANGAKWLNAQNGANYEGVADNPNQAADAGNYWQFIKVTEVPLTIAANDYTTLCLPFNVELPQGSTVKAYYASDAAGDVLKLTEITDGIIPANQGVILQNTGDAEATINLTITTDEATTLTGNKLKGVTAKREGYDALSNYVLADKNGIGFYKAKFTAIAANKAYLPVANVQNAQGVMMAFSFGDEVTGIDNVNAAAPAAKKYYDLQGRRVLYPAKGIFVTEDGQKVLFK